MPTTKLVYQLVLANTFNNNVEEEGSPTWWGCKTSKSYDEEKTMTNSNEKEENIESMTLRSKLGSNDVSSTPIQTSFVQYVWRKNKWYHWKLKGVKVGCLKSVVMTNYVWILLGKRNNWNIPKDGFCVFKCWM
jgi:hypothetical protein